MVKFWSSSAFSQMAYNAYSGQNMVEMFCQINETKGKPEIIFNLEIPKDFNDELAQFSIGKDEAELVIQTLKNHFKID